MSDELTDREREAFIAGFMLGSITGLGLSDRYSDEERAQRWHEDAKAMASYPAMQKFVSCHWRKWCAASERWHG